METDPLQQAISLNKSGDKKSAIEVLKNLLKRDPRNEAAWLWLSACVESDEQKRYCLQKVVEINPENRNATAALQKLSAPEVPKVEEILSKSQPVRNKTSPEPTVSKPSTQPKPKKKGNWVITFFAFLGFLVLAYACLSALNGDDQTSNPNNLPPPTAIQSLTVQAGSLLQYENQITKDTIVNVYKNNGTLDERQGDLKELCLDWLYYRAKIMKYESSGDSDKADEARDNFNKVNAWLDEYNEDDVQTMFSIIEDNNWSRW